MDIWDFLSLLWIPSLVIGIAFQIRAVYLKNILVKKYGFHFPLGFFKPVNIGELKTNYQMSDSQSLKQIISKFIFSKKCFYFFSIAAILIAVVPVLFKLWLTWGNTHK
jgi:predicted membrane protein